MCSATRWLQHVTVQRIQPWRTEGVSLGSQRSWFDVGVQYDTQLSAWRTQLGIQLFKMSSAQPSLTHTALMPVLNLRAAQRPGDP